MPYGLSRLNHKYGDCVLMVVGNVTGIVSGKRRREPGTDPESVILAAESCLQITVGLYDGGCDSSSSCWCSTNFRDSR